MTRRSNHEGTEPRPHSSGGYYAHIQIDGKRATVYGKTPAEVTRKKRDRLRRHEDGQPLTDTRAKFGAWVERWGTVTMEATEKAQGTKDQYRDICRRYVVPVIGADKPLAKVAKSDCESVLVAMKKAGLSASYRCICYAAMRNLFRAAKSEGLIKATPMADVERPAVDDREEAAHLSREEAGALVAALAGHRLGGHRSVWLHIVQTGLLTGLRRGEMLGLRWEDIDDDVMELRQQTTRNSDGLAQRKLKTKGSRRDIDVGPALADVLRQRRKAQMADRLEAGAAWVETGLVFTTGVGTAIEPNNVNRAFRGAVKRAGLPAAGVTPHTLRHSAATFLLESGVSMKEVQKILGHTKISTTMDIYAHVSPERRAAAMAKLEGALGWAT